MELVKKKFQANEWKSLLYAVCLSVAIFEAVLFLWPSLFVPRSFGPLQSQIFLFCALLVSVAVCIFEISNKKMHVVLAVLVATFLLAVGLRGPANQESFLNTSLLLYGNLIPVVFMANFFFTPFLKWFVKYYGVKTKNVAFILFESMAIAVLLWTLIEIFKS